MTSPVDPSEIGRAAAGGIAGAWLTGSQTIDGLIPGADAANAVIDGIVASRRWLSVRHNWIRVGWTVGGAFLMYMGVIMLAQPAVSTVAQAAGKAAELVPMGKAAKAVVT